jgi:hypothetical protein
MDSPLSFDSTENFRKKLLSINLPPYRINGETGFNDKPATNEIVLVDYSVIDSPNVEDIGDKQERILITKNQYGPGSSDFGTSVDINVDKNTNSNEGPYGLSTTIGSKLEKNGDYQETLLYVENIYVPKINGFNYGNTRYDINNNQQKANKNDVYDITDTFNNELEQVGNSKEIELKPKNIYNPTGRPDYGRTRYSINNDVQKANKNDVYDISDTLNNELEQVGNSKEIELKPKNVYSPNGQDYGSTLYDINNDEVINTTGFGLYPERGLDPFWVSNNNVSNVGFVEFFDNTIKNKFKLIAPNGVIYNINDDNNFLLSTPGSELNVYDQSTQSLQVINQNRLSVSANFKEVELYNTNIYRPVSSGFNIQFYGDTKYSINNDLFNSISTGFGEYNQRFNDPNWVLGNYVSTKGNQKEGEAYQINIWKPLGNGNNFYGNTRYDLNFDFVNILTQDASGTYLETTANDEWIVSFSNALTNLANNPRILLYNSNQYRPDSSFGNVKWSINDDVQGLRESGLPDNNGGTYGLEDTEPSLLEIKGKNKEIEIYGINYYKPQTNTQPSAPYGTTRYTALNDIPLTNNLNPNPGEYNLSDTTFSRIQIPLENKATQAYEINLYKPQNDGSSYGPYRYDITDDEQIEVLSNPGANNKGEYGPNQTSANNSNLEINAETELIDAYNKNKYVPENNYGNPELVNVNDLPIKLLGQPYANSDGGTRVFVPSIYTPYAILIQNDPKGSDGSVSQDSTLMGIATDRLKKEFAYRVTAELLQQTIGRINVLDTSFNQPDGLQSTQLSVKPNTDPFDVLGIATGNIPLIERNWAISVPDLIIGKTLNFAAKLAGLYSPYSFIPGEYFDYPNERFLTQVTDNPVAALFKPVFSKLYDITSFNIDTASELFLSNTGSGTQKELFTQLKYNLYVPDYKLNSFRDPNIFAPDPKYYVGKRKSFIKSLIKKDELPKAKFEKRKREPTPVYGDGIWARLYEGDLYDELTKPTIYQGEIKGAFGVESISDFDNGDIQGGFTWAGNRNETKPQIGKKVGPNGREFKTSSAGASSNTFQNRLNNTLSGKNTIKNKFTEGSILEATQKLVDVANDIGNDEKRLRHVGTAINQISKVFNDGYTEMTKGSRIVKWRTKNSVDKSTVKGGIAEGLEYCRVWTKDDPYAFIGALQKTDGITKSGRKFNNSVLDNTYNLNIGPMKNTAGGDSTNIFPGGAKKYMLSLENLAWRTSNRPGYTVEDLALCERGPNGGRIMWFPPYDVTFDESVSTDWNPTTFLGRTEPIYTYSNTKRTGKLSFKIVVDHPCILDKLVSEELAKEDESRFTAILNSFFAGCLKYDPYEVASQFTTFTLSDIFEVIEKTGDPQVIKELVPEVITPPNTVKEEIVEESNEKIEEPVNTEELGKSDFNEFINTFPVMYYANDKPSTYDVSSSTTGSENEAATSFDIYYEQYAESAAVASSSTPQITQPTTLQRTPRPWLQTPPLNMEEWHIAEAIRRSDGENKYSKYPPASNRKNRVLVPISSVSRSDPDFFKTYIDSTPNSIKEMFSYIRTKKTKLDEFLTKTLEWLSQGNSMSFKVLGSASANYYVDSFNKSLSARRVSAFVKYMEKFSVVSSNGKKLNEFFKYDHTNGKADKNFPLTFEPTFAGFSPPITTQDQFSGIDCSKPFPLTSNGKNTGEATHSVNAIACRKVSIVDIKLVEKSKPTPEPKVDETEKDKPDPKNTNTSDKPEPPKEPKYIEKTVYPKPTYETVVKQNLKGKLLKKLVCECDYFEMLQNDSPTVFNGLKEQLKYFHPAFHAITPEGLNKRLVFLQQCMRPGDTVPTVVETGPGTTTLLYKDAFNSAFGAPPVCVLRVGDFWHTKIVIDSLSLTYPKDGQWDINPEGIGLQPMIAEVSINFNFIGGHGLKEPISQLQNALSFNFYANTEMYDERAEQTEIVASNFDQEFIENIKNEIGLNDRNERQNENDYGVPFGNIVKRDVDIPNNTIKGTIDYKEKVNQLAKISREYLESTYNELRLIYNQGLIGLNSIFTDSRKYTSGVYGTNTLEVIGLSTKIEKNLQDLQTLAISDVENDNCPLLKGMNLEDFTNLNKLSIKSQLKRDIKERINYYKFTLLESNSRLQQKELEFVKIVDQINFIYSGKDGYKRENGDITIFDISGGTPSVNTFPDAYTELKGSVDDLYLDMDQFNTNLKIKNIIPQNTLKFNDNFTFETYILEGQQQLNVGPENRFFILFGGTILSSPLEYVNKFLQDSIDNAGALDRIKDSKKEAWKTFLLNNANSLETKYKKSKEKTDKFFTEFEETDLYKEIIKDTYLKPFDISRVLEFFKQNPTNDTDAENWRKITSDQSVGGNEFNLKKKFTY